METLNRKCDNCGKEYDADMRNIKRGWGLCCSKSCAASKREKTKPNYSAVRVEKNNYRRATWDDGKLIDSNYYGEYRGKITSEGYKIYGNTAVDEFGDPVYDVGIGNYDEGDSEYWDNSDNGNSH